MFAFVSSPSAETEQKIDGEFTIVSQVKFSFDFVCEKPDKNVELKTVQEQFDASLEFDYCVTVDDKRVIWGIF